MRKETANAAEAFVKNEDFKANRTYVTADDGLYLHGSRIARRVTHEGKKCFAFNMCGHPTNLTIDRLNGITSIAFGIEMFRMKKGVVYFGHGLLRDIEPDETIYVPIDFTIGDHHARTGNPDRCETPAQQSHC